MMRNRLRFLISVPLIFGLLGTRCESQDWLGLRGNDGRGTVETNGLLSRTSNVELKIRWKIKIGSGYSSVIVADGIAVALYSEPPSASSTPREDVVIGIDADTGEKLWRYSLGPFYLGQNGSFDGPLSTPIIHRGNVYGLAPRGRLFCIDLKTGDQQWVRELQDEEQAPIPNYGFTTSPIVVDGILVVQIGAKDRSVAGFDLATGETKWAVGDDSISSQTPLKTEFTGRPVVLAVGSQKLIGVNPNTGKIEFEFKHNAGDFSAVTPVPIGDGKFVMTVNSVYSIAVALESVADSIHVSEVWKSRSIKNTYNIPVFVDENLYAFSARFLTCVNPDTGQARWKSRAAGDGFLIAVDRHLIISTKKGGLHIAKASPDGYSEIAKAQIFDELVWSVPAYSDDSIFVRSLGEIARVDIVEKANPVVAARSAEIPVGKEFSSFLSEVASASTGQEKSKVVDRFLAAHPTSPIIEEDIAHFVYRGAANDLAIGSDLFGSRQEKKMVPIKGTDFFYYAVKLPLDQRANYYFLKDFQPVLDSRNLRSITSSMYRGEMEFDFRVADEPRLQMSWFAMPEWKQPAYFPLPETMAGELREHTIGAESDVTIAVYTPPKYDSDRQYPVVYVFEGDVARSRGKLDAIVDSIYQLQNTTKKIIAPECIVVFVTTPLMAPPEPELMPEVIVPFIDRTFSTVANRDGRLLVGFSFGGTSAFAVLSRNPELFSKCSVQSPMVFEFFSETIIEAFKQITQPVNVRLEWGRFDTHNPDENWDMRSMTESLIDEIEKNDNVNVTGTMVNDSTGWSSWRNRIDSILQMLDDD